MKHAEWQLFGIVASIIIISLLPIVFISCSDHQRNPVEPSNQPHVTNLIAAVSDDDVECVVEKPLWAGAAHNDTDKGTRVGTVIVKNDSTTLEVMYAIDDDYTLNEAHVYVGTSPPPKVAPGQFPYHSVPLSIPLSTFDASEGGKLYIAAHADVCATGCESAWAGGDTDIDHTFIEEGISKKWGWYFPYIKSCDERARRSRTAADMRALGTALGTYMVDYDIYPFTGDWPAFLDGYYEGAKKDGWSTDYAYSGDVGEYTLRSFGKDHEAGAEEGAFDSDIVYVNGQFMAPAPLVQ